MGRRLKENNRSQVSLAREAARRTLKHKTMTEIKSLARTQTRNAINTLVQIMRNEDLRTATEPRPLQGALRGPRLG